MASLHDSSFYCITEQELPQGQGQGEPHVNFRNIYVDVSITFACLGAFGAIWQLISWRMIEKDRTGSDRKRRTISPVVAVSLAVANLFTCIGIIARTTGLRVTTPPSPSYMTQPDNCTVFKVTPTVANSTIIAGTAIEVFINYMYAASAMWTIAYAVDVYSRITRCESEHYIKPPTWLYHVICWGVPVLTTTGGTLALWIKSAFPGRCADPKRLLWRYMFSCIPMVLGLLINPVIFWRAHSLSMKLSRRTGTYSHTERDVMQMLKVKFMIIVGAYSACWLPNIAGSIVQLAVMSNCKTWDNRYKLLLPFWLMEAILNPLQGLFNCFLYRQGLFACFYNRRRTERSIQSSIEEEESRSLLGENRFGARLQYR